MENGRKYYLDYLKIISAFAVILIHVVSEYWYGLDVTSTNFKMLTVFDGLVRFCVPIYFMISGALFLSDDKKITIKDLYKKNIFKIIILFIFWTVLYKSVYIVFYENNVLTLSKFFSLLFETLQGNGAFHLSFLVYILGFYMCVPMLKMITQKNNKKIIEYFIIILFIFLSVNLLLNKLFNISFNYFILFKGYIIYFILGYYLDTFELKHKNIIYVLGIIFAVLTPYLTIKYSQSLQLPSELFFDYLSPNVIVYSCFIFLLIKNLFKNNCLKNSKFLLFFRKTYFGIYLLHGFVLGVIVKYQLFNIDICLPFLVIILTIIVSILSIILSYVFGKIPVVKKIITI